jgi:hypothetical protein
MTAVQTSEAGATYYKADCSLGLFLVERELKIWLPDCSQACSAFVILQNLMSRLN